MGKLNEALQLYQNGEIDTAIYVCKQELQNNNENYITLNMMGAFLNSKSDFKLAIEYLLQAVAISPSIPDAYINLGISYSGLKNFKNAISAYLKGLKFSPKNTKLMFNLGVCYQSMNKYNLAIEIYEEIIKINPRNKGAFNNLGLILLHRNQLNKAIDLYTYALTISPSDKDYLNNLGLAYKRLPDTFELAVDTFMEVLSQDPENVLALSNLGSILAKSGDDRGPYYCKKAHILSPNSTDILFNYAYSLQQTGKISAAIEKYYQCLNIDPSYVNAKFNLGICNLLLGKFSEGWYGYETRFSVATFDSVKIHNDIPRWDGIYHKNSRLVIWGEQGLGDQIMFSTILFELMDSKMHITIEVEPRLVNILKRTFLKFSVVPFGEAGEQFEYQLPIGSLPFYFRQSFYPVIKPQYLSSDYDKANYFMYKYQRMFPGKKLVGISWRSSNIDTGRLRSIPFDLISEYVKQHTDIQFIVLQNNLKKSEKHEIISIPNLLIDKDVNDNFDNYFASISILDKVITVDNTCVHVAGSAGVDTTLLLSDVPEWRWQLYTKQCFWYKSVNIVRKEKNSWSCVLQTLNLK